MENKERNFMSFAIIETGGKQYKVSASKILEIEKLNAKVGEIVKFKNVLLLNDNKNTEIGNPSIEGATVEGKLLDNVKDRTVLVFHKRRRKHSTKKNRHRQRHSKVQITKILAKGGKGGLGNTNFKSSTNRAPRQFTSGEDKQDMYVWLSLKLFADIGIVGKPNAGKSTLLSKISGATPKIADYPFTTVHPILGVLRKSDEEIVIADIPGLIEGAHEGKGLGDQFLAHIERCKVILHVIDSSQVNIVEDYITIEKELKKYGKNLTKKKKLLALSKIDLSEEKIMKISNEIEKKFNIKPILFSSFSKKGIKDLELELFKACDKLND